MTLKRPDTLQTVHPHARQFPPSFFVSLFKTVSVFPLSVSPFRAPARPLRAPQRSFVLKNIHVLFIRPPSWPLLESPVDIYPAPLRKHGIYLYHLWYAAFWTIGYLHGAAFVKLPFKIRPDDSPRCIRCQWVVVRSWCRSYPVPASLSPIFSWQSQENSSKTFARRYFSFPPPLYYNINHFASKNLTLFENLFVQLEQTSFLLYN